MVLVSNTNRDDSIIEARSLFDAIVQMIVADNLPPIAIPRGASRPSSCAASTTVAAPIPSLCGCRLPRRQSAAIRSLFGCRLRPYSCRHRRPLCHRHPVAVVAPLSSSPSLPITDVNFSKLMILEIGIGGNHSIIVIVVKDIGKQDIIMVVENIPKNHEIKLLNVSVPEYY
ncbi:uncharacterized protein HKW66_Vig0105340 [Vigna angularis]|uniref:Uncharacterized protein n=1 Tax=Phaseolus angularis TaxID=3914 RepID=A0A8T0KMN1_PHAAN|nr:uncharacterized protein HKW66_Vig0105340 [Vigna angularis]